MGRMVQLFAETVRFSRNTTWMRTHLDPVLRIGHWLLRARRDAVAAFSPSDARHGLIYGPAEHGERYAEHSREAALRRGAERTPAPHALY